MLKHLIQPIITQYGRIKTNFLCGKTSKVSSLNSINAAKKISFDIVIMASIYLLGRKRLTKQVCKGIGFLSGCCFSKSSDDYEPILETTENLVASVQQPATTSEKLLATTAQCLVSEVQHNLKPYHSKEADNKLQLEYADNIDKRGEVEPDKVPADKANKLSVALLENTTDDEIVYKGTKKNKRRKLNARTMANTSQPDATFSENQRGKRKQKPVKILPNYFVAFQISNPEIHEAMYKVQNYIIEQDSRLASSFVSVLKSHITLMVMHLANEEEHSKALDALKIVHKELNESMFESPLKLQFKGIGNFRNNVVFAKLQEDEGLVRLQNYAACIESHFNNASIISTDQPSKAFNPHLTLMKLSKNPKLRRQGIKVINPSVYEEYKDELFGVQVVKGIQLLSMFEPSDKNGYYVGTDLPFEISGE